MAKVIKSKEQHLYELTAKGHLDKSIAALAAEKRKPKTAPKKFVSSKTLFPNRPELFIEVLKSAKKSEIAEIITKRMNQVPANPFRRKLN